MNNCAHQPVFKFKNLFVSKPSQVCRHCGAAIELTPVFNLVLRTIYMILIALLLIKTFLDVDFFGLTGTNRLIADIALIFGVVLLALVGIFLLTVYGKYQEVAPKTVISDQAPAEKPYTQEQLDLMALYESYEQQAREDGSLPAAQSPAQTTTKVEEDVCEHTPVKSWKNYVPSQYDFVCEKCGKPITFLAESRKKQNILYLGLMVLVFMPTLFNQKVEFWLFALIIVGVVGLGIVVQLMALKKGAFEIKVLNDRKRR